MLERFQAKWQPVRVKKTRQIKNLEPRFDFIEAEKALDLMARFGQTNTEQDRNSGDGDDGPKVGACAGGHSCCGAKSRGAMPRAGLPGQALSLIHI